MRYLHVFDTVVSNAVLKYNKYISDREEMCSHVCTYT